MLRSSAFLVPKWSICTEWSTTRSTGTSGSITFGFLPIFCATLRIAARSQSSVTPVKSWSRMRASTNGISSARLAFGFQPASSRTCASVTFLPSQLRSTDSSTMRIETGSRSVFTPSFLPRAGNEWSLPCLKDCSVLNESMITPRSDHEQVDELADGRRGEPVRIHAKIENSLLLLRREAARQVGLELLHQDRHPFGAAALVPDRVLAHDFLELGAVLELHAERIGDRALPRVVVVAREPLVFNASDLLSKRVNPRIPGDIVLVVRCGEPPEDERH